MKQQGFRKSTLILGIILAIALIAFVFRYLPVFMGEESESDLSRAVGVLGVSSSEAQEQSASGVLGVLVDPFVLRVPVSKIGEDNTAGEGTGAPVYTPPATAGLGGVWITDTGRYALIGEASVSEGDEVDGWRVKKINADNVVLTKDGESKILRLEENQ